MFCNKDLLKISPFIQDATHPTHSDPDIQKFTLVLINLTVLCIYKKKSSSSTRAI